MVNRLKATVGRDDPTPRIDIVKPLHIRRRAFRVSRLELLSPDRDDVGGRRAETIDQLAKVHPWFKPADRGFKPADRGFGFLFPKQFSGGAGDRPLA